MLGIAEAAGGSVINRDRMWHYVEGVRNWDPIWTGHGIRILPGPSSLWLDARGNRLPVPLLSRVRHARHARTHLGHRLRLFVVHPDPPHHREGVRPLGVGAESRHHEPKLARRCCERVVKGMPAPVKAFMDRGEDFIVERELGDAGVER